MSSLLFSVVLAGGGGVWFAGSGHVSLESAGSACALHVLLAGAVRSADLHLLQHTGPAALPREATLPFPHKVSRHPLPQH